MTHLTQDDTKRLLAEARSYRSKGHVTAVRATADSHWTTANGDTLFASAGDWWVIDGDERWSVAASVFAATYEEIARGTFRKKVHVVATQIEQPFELVTLEGIASGNAGDWLVQNPSGECWPVPATVFARRYELVQTH